MNKLTIKIDTFDKIKSFARKVVKFESDINLYKGSQLFDAKSILSIIALIDLSGEIDVQMISVDEDEIIAFIKDMEEFR